MIKDLNHLNQVCIALKRAGYKGIFDADFGASKPRNHIEDAKYFCWNHFTGEQQFPISIDVNFWTKSYLIVNWDLSEPMYSMEVIKG